MMVPFIDSHGVQFTLDIDDDVNEFIEQNGRAWYRCYELRPAVALEFWLLPDDEEEAPGIYGPERRCYFRPPPNFVPVFQP